MRKNCPRVIHSRDVLARQSGIIQCWSFGRSWLNGLRAFLIRFERGSHLAQITSAESVDGGVNLGLLCVAGPQTRSTKAAVHARTAVDLPSRADGTHQNLQRRRRAPIAAPRPRCGPSVGQAEATSKRMRWRSSCAVAPPLSHAPTRLRGTSSASGGRHDGRRRAAPGAPAMPAARCPYAESGAGPGLSRHWCERPLPHKLELFARGALPRPGRDPALR